MLSQFRALRMRSAATLMHIYTVFITSPLEPVHVERIRIVAQGEAEVLYRPDLLPPVRYIADHHGGPFQRTPDQEQAWLDLLAKANILWDFPSNMAFAPNVRWVQTTSTGVGQQVHQLGIQDSDILVTTARGVHGGPLAEFVILALLAHFRGLRHLQAKQIAHQWIRYCAGEMAGKTVATVGAGDLARATATLARAFGMRTEAITRRPQSPRSHGGVFDAIHPIGQLHAVLGTADAVVVTTPHTPETEHLMDSAAFSAMKPGAAFVNISRGQIVDEQALIHGLRSGHVGFAALDVAAVEPLPEDSPLWDMTNVLISPHSASTVPRENERITEIFCYNLRCYVEGRREQMKNILDKRLMY
jgi:phosphoglycerate dehydrogenase-like enzyme